MNINPLPLEGVRVVDLSWIIAGPTATRHLALMGADVIKLGSNRRPDPSTGSAPFQVYNQSKSYAALNLSRPQGLELAKSIIAVSDVVVENFAAGVIERIGLSYESICKANPSIIMVSSSGTGHTGPDKDYVAYGSLLQHYTSWNAVSGYPDHEPIRGGLWADPWVGMELCMVILSALNHRAVTGNGNYVDFSMAEALSATIPEAILDYQMNKIIQQPMGNRDEWASPHELYRCKGHDRWIAISVTNNVEWEALCRVIGKEDWIADVRFSDTKFRQEHVVKIDSTINAWTLGLEDYEATRILQAAEVPAGPSLNSTRVFQDPQLRETGYISKVRTADGEPRELPGLPWRFQSYPGLKNDPAPVLGQHNDRIYVDILGLTRPEVTQLIEDQVIY